MENRINIAELLENCPKGMELDCALYENLEFDHVEENKECVYIICRAKTETGIYNIHTFTKHGCYSTEKYSTCVIFPKGKTTWDGFVPPCQFKNGDILFIDCAEKESDGDVYKYIFILKEIDSLGNYFSYCHLSIDGIFPNSHYLADNRYTPRFATEEEKEKLFKAIKDNGYKWNAETNTLEKFIAPKFKVGDRVKSKFNNNLYDITDVTNTHYVLIDITNKFRYVENIKEDKNWELVPNKFDISTFKPFDKVLTRATNGDVWGVDFFGFYKDGWFLCNVHAGYRQCIPYRGNEHLLGTTDDCDEFYKTW